MIANPTATKNRAGVPEMSVLVRTPGPVLGVEFQPRLVDECSMVAGVRTHAGYDAADPANGIDARDGGAIPPPACEHPYEVHSLL